MKRQDPIEVIVVGFATLLGLGIRLAIVIPSPFPLNDGGLFYTMIGDLVANRLSLPALSTYNAASIPFAYPPLAFYVYALLHLGLRIPVLQLMQFGPAVISAATIPAFYLLARDMLQSAQQATLGTLVFALLPRAFDWLIMGGGVTRSLGLLFGLLAIRQAYRLFGRGERRAVVPLIVLGSLVVYSHPEAAAHTAIAAIIFYLWKDRSGKGLMNGLAAAAGTAALTAPWWGTILAQHGADPFVAVAAAARADSYSPVAALVTFLRLDFADEPFIALLTALGLVGIALDLSRRKYLLPTWLLGMYVLEPRGAPTFMMIPLAMSAGLALDMVILPALNRPGTCKDPDTDAPMAGSPQWLGRLLGQPSARWALGFVLVFSAVSAYAVGWQIRESFTLKPGDLQALDWVRTKTAATSQFAVVTGQLPLRDSTSEWFPALTNRQSVATVFGYEWVKDGRFAGRIEEYRDLQTCAQRDVACLRAWGTRYGVNYDFVYIQNVSDVSSVALTTFLSQSQDFEPVYRSATVAIFAPK